MQRVIETCEISTRQQDMCNCERMTPGSKRRPARWAQCQQDHLEETTTTTETLEDDTDLLRSRLLAHDDHEQPNENLIRFQKETSANDKVTRRRYEGKRPHVHIYRRTTNELRSYADAAMPRSNLSTSSDVSVLLCQVLALSMALVLGCYATTAHSSADLLRRSTDDPTQAGKGGGGCQAQTVGQRAIQSQQSASSPSTASAATKQVFCFYDIQDDFRPQDLNPCLCTHVVYSYVAVRRNLSFIAGKKGDLRSLASLKRKNPSLKLLVSLRPDDFFTFESVSSSSSPAPPLGSGEQQVVAHNQAQLTTATPFAGDDLQFASAAPVAQNQTGGEIVMNEMHQKFAKRIRDFIVRHSLDGINLDWPYFAQLMGGGGGGGGANASRDHLTLTLQAINEQFAASLGQSSPSAAYLRNLQAPVITLTVSKDFYSLTESYDFHKLNKLLDYVHLPAFDFDLNVDQYSIGHPARLHGIFDAENLDTLVDLLLSSGLPSDQLIAGVPSHGVQITSRPTAVVGNGGAQVAPSGVDAAAGPSGANSLDEQLEAAANISIVSHADVCRVRDMARQNCSATGGAGVGASATCWTMSRSRDLTAPFAYDSEHWIGFDDETSVKLKAKYVLLRHLAGVALFTVNNDDPAGQCGFGPYPLLATINGVFARAPAIVHAQALTGGSRGGDPLATSGSSGRSYFTRAPNQILTATSLVSQIFGSKTPARAAQQATATTSSTGSASGDLMQSASDEMPANHRGGADTPTGPNTSDSPTSSGSGLMSFVDIIEKYGSVQRLDGSGRVATSAGTSGSGPAPDQDSDATSDRALPCDKVGYQRYPRDCSRFYRCVQTPPIASMSDNSKHSAAAANNETTAPSSGLPVAMKKPHSNVASTSITRLQYECPSGLVFDEQYQICNWPSWSAQCTGSGEVNSITNSKFVCPNYGYFQNQENCEYFYYCSDYNRGTTQAYQFRCPFELGFDEEKLQCNWKWLVKGCVNATSGTPPTTTSLPPMNSTNLELAKKYLSALEVGKQQQVAPSEEKSAQVGVVQTTQVASATTTEQPPPPPVVLARSKRSISDSSAAEPGQEREGRAFTPAIGSHLTSLMASIAAIREHRMKKAGQQQQQQGQGGGGFFGLPFSSSSTTSNSNKIINKDTTTTGGADQSQATKPKPMKYPAFVGTPQNTQDSTAAGQTAAASQLLQAASVTSAFRLRRRQQTTASSPGAADKLKQSPASVADAAEAETGPSKLAGETGSGSGGISPPYRRRPPPASIFPFLPTSAIYMVADSIRSYGEAISDEMNRYIRIAGDRVRDVLGQRPSRRKHNQYQHHGQHHAASRRREDGDDDQEGVAAFSPEHAAAGTLAKFAGKLSSGAERRAHQEQQQHLGGAGIRRLRANEEEEDVGVASAAPIKRGKRTRRDTSGHQIDQLDDLEALESAAPVQQIYAAPPPQQTRHAHPQQQHQRPVQQQQQQQYRDSLGRPPGYPLNPLDEAAKGAVLGPEPKLYHQPAALMINQLSGISQADYERLMRHSPPLPQQQRPLAANGYLQQSADSMMGSASEPVPAVAVPQQLDHGKVIDRIIEHAREAFTIGHQQQEQSSVPFGMPALTHRPVHAKEAAMSSQSESARQTVAAPPPQKQRRRSTVAQKLAATLSLPKLTSLLPSTSTTTTSSTTTSTTTSTPPTDGAQESGKSKGGYMSFLPSFSDVVVAPARNIMNRAMGFNRAVQDLISTLAPGGGGGSSSSPAKNQQQEQQFRPTLPIQMPTTPMPAHHQQQQQQHHHVQNQNNNNNMQNNNFRHQQGPPPGGLMMMTAGSQRDFVAHQQRQQQQQQVPNHHQQQPVGLVNQLLAHLSNGTNGQGGPLLLTEDEARALSAQLDQLSKEQLEALSDDMFRQQQQQQRPLAPESQRTHTAQQQQQQQQQPPVTESPDYVLRLLKMLSQTSQNPDDVRLLDQLASQLNNPKPNGSDQSLIEIGQPDDLALLEALGMIPASQQNKQQVGGETPTSTRPPIRLADNQPEASYNSYQHSDMNSHHPFMKSGAMKPLVQSMHQQQQQHQKQQAQLHPPTGLKLVDGLPPLEFADDGADAGTTKFVPVALDVINEPTTPSPRYAPHPPKYPSPQQPQPAAMYEPKQMSHHEMGHYGEMQPQTYYGKPMGTPNYPTPAAAYGAPSTHHYNYPQHYQPTYETYEPYYTTTTTTTSTTTTTTSTTTTTTTTTPQPTQLVEQVFQEQVIEKRVPPVKQTYTELIENNVTTPDGIETTLETRTKTAVSGGASFDINSQVGLGMIPAAFGGALPSDSPMSQQLDSMQQARLLQLANGTSTSTGINTVANQTSTGSALSVGGVKGGPSSTGGDFSGAQFDNSFNGQQSGFNQFGDSNGQFQQVSGDFSSGDQFVGGGGDQFATGGSGGGGTNRLNEAQLLAQRQQLLGGGGGADGTGLATGGRTATSTSTNRVFAQGAQQPLTSRTVSSAFSGPRSQAGGSSLGGYNFATEPVNQFEEVVIKKKFKPFPKTMVVPQTSTFTIEETSQAQAQPQPVVIVNNQQQESSAFEQSDQQQRQEQIEQQQQQQSTSATDFGRVSISATPTSSSSSSSSALASSSSGSGGANEQQIKEDEFSTVASTFGEPVAARFEQRDVMREPVSGADGNGPERDNANGSGAAAAAASQGEDASGNTRTSLTRQELLSGQQQVAKDLRSIEMQLQLQESAGGDQFSSTGEVTSINSGDINQQQVVSARSQLEREQLSSDDLATTSLRGKTTAIKPSSRKSAKKSRKSAAKQQKQVSPPTRSSTTTTTTTTTTTAAPATTQRSESSTAKRSVEPATPTSAPNAVEEAFTNLMVELKRSRKQTGSSGSASSPTTTSTTTSTTTTSTTKKPDSGELSPKQKRKSRSKKREKSTTRTATTTTSSGRDLEGAGSAAVARQKQQTTRRRSQQTGSADRKPRRNLQAGERIRGHGRQDRLVPAASAQQQHEQVAVYGTKSGFMPILKPDDPSYAPLVSGHNGHLSHDLVDDQSLATSDPLSFGASFTSSKHQALPAGQDLGFRPTRGGGVVPSQARTVNSSTGKRLKQVAAQTTTGESSSSISSGNSWHNYFVRKLSDQISVVNLGNFTEAHHSRPVQAKLVILPASPNNQLLNPKNWQHLASNYPQLFPRDLSDLSRAEIVDLGKTSISLSNGGLIDEHAEQARYLEFRARYEQLAALIEQRTFKALDEIVQRSSGQMFLIQRRDSHDRTLIAVIPDRPFIRTAMSPTGGYQRLVMPATPTLTTTTPAATEVTPTSRPSTQPKASNNMISTYDTTTSTASTSTTTTTTAAAAAFATERETTTTTGKPLPAQSPQKAATFSRAIQESIQEAIRHHYDAMKSQLRQSMAEGDESAPMPTTLARGQPWSTPSPDTLAHMEQLQAVAQQQRIPGAESVTSSSASPPLPGVDPMDTASSSTEYSVVRVPAPEQKPEPAYSSHAVYEVEGAEPKSLYGLDLMDKFDRQRYETAVPTDTPIRLTSPAPAVQPKTHSTQAPMKPSRFISIGSHLIASPMKRIVDQAYVNHFYDHISDHQLAKSIGFDELMPAVAGGEQKSSNETISGEPAKTNDQDQPEQQQLTAAGEDSLVPESACTRAGLFQHPFACNKFYECFWDKQLSKFTLHMFECPIKLAFDERIVGCAMPIESSLCVNM